MNYETDNIIEWIFEKAFNQLTNNSKNIYYIPFKQILQQTFYHSDIHCLINRLTNRNLDLITNYLSNQLFIKNFLIDRTERRIHALIILDDQAEIEKLIEHDHQIDEKCLLLAALNNHLRIVETCCSKSKLIPEMLIHCAEYGYEELYFYLRSKELIPNLKVYNQAVIGGNLNIIKDVNECVGIMDEILVTAFQTNHTSMIIYLLDIAQKDHVHISPNLVTYPILNDNMELLKIMEERKHFQWHRELYFSALLSGSMIMIKYVENKLPNLHIENILDTSKIKKGKISLLLEDVIYHKNNKKYFSHTMNYAVQSGSLEIVKYICSLGYGITPSNFITAIKQGTVEILDFLCQNYYKTLPFYLIHYFGFNSFTLNKMEKALILYKHDILPMSYQNLSLNDYKKESTHLDMITQCESLNEANLYDEDYLVKYQLFFVPDIGYKLNHRLISLVRLCLKLELDDILMNITSLTINEHDQRHFIDTLFLFGNIKQIKKFHPLIALELIKPSVPIVMELLCYCQINKLCYLLHHNLLTNEVMQLIYPIVTMLSDDYLNLFFSKLINLTPNVKHIFLSKKRKSIDDFLNENNITLCDMNDIKPLLKLDDLNLLNKVIIDQKILPELISWTKENGLIKVYYFLLEKYSGYALNIN